MNKTNTTEALKVVRIEFVDGETSVEWNVNEVRDREDTLFLRRYGQTGTEFDKQDIKSFTVSPQAGR